VGSPIVRWWILRETCTPPNLPFEERDQAGAQIKVTVIRGSRSIHYARRMLRLRRFTVVAAVVSTLVTGAFTGTVLASTHVGDAAAKYPPCTKAALSAAITNGRFLKPFGCVRNWAYSFVLVGKGNAEFEATVLYHNNNGRWRISNRTGPCRTHAVPKKIYQPACETN
jgi:hypothetical protein